MKLSSKIFYGSLIVAFIGYVGLLASTRSKNGYKWFEESGCLMLAGIGTSIISAIVPRDKSKIEPIHPPRN